ncbi:dihydrolipoyl dehydrogenase [Aestuariirhabdus litorea]|uniref:Dihydrolipoyl dehydrogenase n=1 Tax=Aestuariirhabdus litorea TaxID=2528527 RepID=A0A3P3VP56_9GAMM|nr:dihydrolipoyl dehydrogenase [Aestuariirhabdus litorea]RRJ84532.1 dihydrolipoyl dehydrogenase [Aestuariirhabdus litorea]RWW97757.1 dihydrolipoyl dehydrogenase [Endozoicomonadaceae bacterium GTF-13]
MREIITDVAVIGGGSAGLNAYRAAKKHTDRVLLIEGGPWGTTCARVGCMPSKLLIAAAEAAHHYQTSAAFGIDPVSPPTIDGKRVMERVRRERDRFVGFVIESVEEIPSEDRIRGYARFIDNTTLMVDDHTRIVASRVVIASGSTPAIPPGLEGLGDRLLVNDDLFEWEDLPESVAVLGPGVIGLELGQALHRLGVRVHMFGRDGALTALTDPKVKAYAINQFASEFPLQVDSEVESIDRDGERVSVRYRKEQKTVTEHFDYLLVATGRVPNLQSLDLHNTGLALDARGLPQVDPYSLQCENQPIFIAGDSNSQRPLLHEAIDEGNIAGDNAGRWPDVRAGERRAPIAVVFSDPQIAMVGQSYAQLQARYGSCNCFAIGEVSFEGQGRSRVMLKNRGLLRVYGEQGSGILLGAEMIGPQAEHLAHLLAWSIQQRLTVSEILKMPFYHPVIEEGVRTALRDLNHQLHIDPAMLAHCLDCGPGA